MKKFTLRQQEEITLHLSYQCHYFTVYGLVIPRVSEALLLGVSEALLLDDDTLRNYVNRYKEGRVDFLINDNYKGSNAKLTAEQLEALDQQVIVRDDESINAISTIKLLNKIENHYLLAVVIYIVCYNASARYNRSKINDRRFGGIKIKLLFLPPYSLNFNLI